MANTMTSTTRAISSPYADAKYAFGRVQVTYISYVPGSWDGFLGLAEPVNGYSAELAEPSAMVADRAFWQLVRGSGSTAVEATRDLLCQVDAIMRELLVA